MTAPEITAAIDALIASTPPPVTVWGVRYPQSIDGDEAYYPFASVPAGHIVWHDNEAEARSWLAEEQAAGYSAELVSVTDHVRVHPADDTVTCGGAR